MKVVIVEDEHMAAQRLANMLKGLNPAVEILETIASVESAASYFEKNGSPELVFMDIQLSDGISFEIFDLVQLDCPVVFITAYDEYALNAFKVRALDYLLKPLKRKELALVLERFDQEQIQKSSGIAPLEHPNQTKKILIKLGQNLRVLTLSDACFYYSENKITFYVGEDGKRFPVDYSLDALESELGSTDFFRVNRQFIVKDSAIQGMTSYSANRIKLTLAPAPPSEVVVSKDKVSRFRKWLVS